VVKLQKLRCALRQTIPGIPCRDETDFNNANAACINHLGEQVGALRIDFLCALLVMYDDFLVHTHHFRQDKSNTS
jgi:hypothetical protein